MSDLWQEYLATETRDDSGCRVNGAGSIKIEARGMFPLRLSLHTPLDGQLLASILEDTLRA